MKKMLFFCCFALVSILILSAQDGDNTFIVNGKYFSMLLPDTWQETDGHIILDQIKNETGLSQSRIDSAFKCYVDSQNYYNVLITGERIHSKKALSKVTIEQLVQRSGEKKYYNGLEFLITTDTDTYYPHLTYIGANAIYEDATFYFLFVLNNEDLDIAEHALSSISFVNVKTDDENKKKNRFFSGIWHGIRTPFVFIINFFRKDKIIIFSDYRTAGYTIGYILGILFILSGIFGGSRRN